MAVLVLVLFGQTEADWTDRISPELFPGSKIDHVLYDQSRVDILTENEAIEVDWPRKWPEAIGQAHYYATVTRREPAVMLLSSGASDKVHLLRATIACRSARVRLIVVRLRDYE